MRKPIIAGILVVIAAAAYPGIRVRMHMGELYRTVNTLTKAEEQFYAKHGFFALLPYSVSREDISRFEKVLGVKIPGPTSTFIYGVYYDPAQIYVRVRKHAGDPSEGGWWVLCSVHLAGENKQKWEVGAYNPWSKYLDPPAGKIMNYTFAPVSPP